MKKLALLLGLVGAALVLAAIGRASDPQASAITRSSTFDSNNEGWFFDNVTSPNPVNPATWQGIGGNPGGYITGHVIAGGAGFNSDWSWGPSNALGDYGGKIQVDMEASDPTAEAVIEFSTNNSDVEPCQDTGGPFANGWHTYSITLDPSGLHDCRWTDTPLTVAQVTAALAGFEQVNVGVFANDKQADFTVDLDNASLSGPQTAVTPPTGTVTRQLALMHKRGRTFHGTLTASVDYSCAGETKVTIFRKAKKPVKVGTAITSAPNTRASGFARFSFKLKRLVKGSYYASARKARSPLDGNTCKAVHSNSVRLR